MLWMGQKPQAKAMEESMTTYFNALQGFLLLSHGSMVGAGPTLSSNIHEAVKKVVDCSFKLLSTSVHSYGKSWSHLFLSLSHIHASYTQWIGLKFLSLIK